MNRSEVIRNWLAEQDGPRTAREISRALGIPPPKTGSTVGEMVRTGILVKLDGKPFLYAPGRQPLRPAAYATEEERLAAQRAQRAAWNAARRLSPEQKVERERQFAQARAEAFERRRVEAAQKKAAAEERRRQARVMPRRPAPPVVVPDAPSPKPAQPARVETIEEFKRRGGKVERLHPAACSQPLKRIGWQPEKRRKAA